MTTQTIFLILVAAILALGFALFQYGAQRKKLTKKTIGLAFLRFLTTFLLFILLINPKFKETTLYTEKPMLVVAVDNSTSIGYLEQKQHSLEAVQALLRNQELKAHFDIKSYAFGLNVKDTTGFSFTENQTNIASALKDLDQIYKQNVAPTILITDGNQTYGSDYQYTTKNYGQQLYPIILGDTIRHTDLKLQQLNVNKYAYLKNKFPVEAIATYAGEKEVKTKFVITSGDATIFSKPLTFSPTHNSETITAELPALQAGIRTYRAAILPMDEEKNKENNQKQFAVEVIDQKTNILVISAMSHPDLGAIKRSVESNERSAVTIVKPNNQKDLDAYELIIVYQPDPSFAKVFEKLKTSQKNYFTITGTQTNWNFLNKAQTSFFCAPTRQTEDFLPELNNNYATFLIEDTNFEDYPPLKGLFGDPTITTEHQILLFQKIGAVSTVNPLLATLEIDNRREGVLFGEGIWKWRAQEYVATKSFQRFDNFFGKIIQYLASNKKRKRLEVTAESFYYGNAGVRIQASYFTKNYEFDRRARLSISVKNKETAITKVIPFVLKNTNYEVDLSSFSAGSYQYTVTVNEEKLSQSGSFTILDFDIEKQFLNADAKKLRQIAENTEGTAFFAKEIDGLIAQLLSDKRYQPIQKQQENIVSLIDWKYLLGFLILLLALEWFIRKYNGLI